MITRGKDQVGDGTAALPGHSFYLDTDTGLYRPGANRLGFATAGTARWEIDASGHWVPAADNTYDVGSAAAEVRNIHFDGTLSGFASAITEPADDTAAATGADEVWGASNLTIADPGRQVNVLFWLNGYAQATGGTARMACQGKIGYLTDGGTTYTVAANASQADLDFDLQIRNTTLSAILAIGPITPTGSIKARPYLRQNTGTAGDVSFNNAVLTCLVLPA